MSSSLPIVDQALKANIRAFRELRGLTQVELAARAGIAAASISHFETGQRVPSLESIVKVADALEVSVDALVGRTPIEEGAHLDPVFLRASRANAQTLDAIRRMAAALLGEVEAKVDPSLAGNRSKGE